MNRKKISIRVRSTFSIGGTGPRSSRNDSNQDLLIELEEGATVESLLHKIPFIGSSSDWLDSMLIVIVNGTLRGFDHVLADNDAIDFHLPVAGG